MANPVFWCLKQDVARSTMLAAVVKKPSQERERIPVVAVVAAFVLSLGFWIGERVISPVPSATYFIDAREDLTRHWFSLVVNVRDAGFYGHAWASWTRHVSNEDWSAQSFGFFAQLGSYTEVFDAEGQLEDEANRLPLPGEDTRIALVVWLDEAQFDKSLAQIKRWRGASRYSLFTRDCVTFVAEVLDALDIELPNRALAPSPWQYIVTLGEGQLWQSAPRPQ